MAKTKGQRESETNTESSNLRGTIQRLEREKVTLSKELWKYKRKPTGKIGYILLFFGAIMSVFAMLYSSNVSAFIGISLIFWGGLFLFVSPTKFIKRSLLEPTSASSFANVNKILNDLNYTGKGIYLPPRYSEESEREIIFIPTETNVDAFPSVEEVAQNKLFIGNPKGICLTPSGLELTNLFEEELGIDFKESNIEYLKDDLKKLFVEGLEIADSFEMESRENNVHVTISNSIYHNFCRKFRKQDMDFCETYSCPLCSSIACALTRITGQPVTIKSISDSSNDESIHIYYQIFGPEPKKQETIISKQNIHNISTELGTPKIKPFQRFITLIPAAIGSIILSWLGWLILFDTLMWNKNIFTILFGSRTGEAISLGIGMRGIHYLIIGLAFFIPYVFIFLKKRLMQKEDL